MRGLLRAAAAVVCVSAPGAAAAETFHMMTAGDGGMIVVDVDTIQRQGAIVRMRDFAILPATQTGSGDLPLDYTSALTAIDCELNTWEATDYIGYNLDGRTTQPEAGTGQWAPIEDGSARSRMRALGCDGTYPEGDSGALNGGMREIVTGYRRVMARAGQAAAPNTGGK